jgi:hypothetical protein
MQGEKKCKPFAYLEKNNWKSGAVCYSLFTSLALGLLENIREYFSLF